MSEHASPTAATDDSVDSETGLEALRSSPEFRGPVEPLDDHHHAHDHANNHFALIYESQEEQFAAAIPFLRQGLERGERCLYITYENSREEVLAAMRDRGIDVDAALDSGQLSIHDEQETYLRNETFDADETLEFIDAAIEEATEEYEALRMAGEMSSVLQEDPDGEELVRCEAKANYLFDEVDGLALCQYNRNRFPADVIHDVISTHPLLVHDGRVSHNVYYTPPEEFFGPEKSEREVERLLGSLAEQTDAKAELHRRERFLRESYRITADPELDFEEKLHQLLDLARDRLDLDAAGLTHLPEWDGAFHTEYALGYGDGDGDGVVEAADDMWTDPGEGCFCRQAIAADEPVGKTDVRGTDWEDDPIHREHGLTCYLGTKVTSGTTPYGTLWVGSTEPRDREFSETERTFLELIGQWVSNELERRQRERKLDETVTELQESEERLRLALEAGEMGTWELDLQTGEAPVRSSQHDRIFGYEEPLDDWSFETFLDHVHPDDRERVEQRFEEASETGKWDFECWITGADGERRAISAQGEFYHDSDGDPVRAVGVVKDITERKQAEEKLQKSREQFRALVTASSDVVYRMSPDWNEMHELEGKDFLSDTDESTSDWVEKYIHPDDRQRVTDAIDEAIRTKSVFEVEHRVEQDDGSIGWTHSRAVPMLNEDGEIDEWIGMASDITERRERKRELERVERQFEATFNNPSAFMGLLDPDGTIRRINDNALEFVGIDEADVRGEKFWEGPWFAHSDELQAELRDAIARAATGEYVRAEIPHRAPDGETIIMDSMLEPVHDEDGEVVAIVPSGHDVTERKRTKQQLADERDMFAAGPAIVFRWDPDPDEGWPVKYVSENVEDVLGYTPAELESGEIPYTDLLLDEDLDRIAAEVAEHSDAATERFTHDPYRVRTKDGDVRWVKDITKIVRDDTGAIDHYLGYLVDITERIERERELRESKNQLRALIDVLPVAVFVAEDDGEIVEWNEAAEEIWGGEVAESESVAEYEKYDGWWADTGEPLDPDEWALARALRGEEVTDPDVVEIEGFDGERRTVLNHGMPVRDADGEVSRAVVTLIDVTEREERKQRLQEQNERLESFASMLAHELRNPVTIGQIYSQQLPEEADTDAVDYIPEAFDRIEDMIDVMLVLTRGRDAVDERTPVALAEVTREAWADVEAPEAEFDTATDRVIQADETYIRHLFRNLFENAVDHGGADVTVEVAELPQGDGFYVADDGPGIPVENRDRVFDVGFTTAGDNGGTGLGLAFVQKLAEVYEWDLSVTESEAGGARFEFRNVF